MALRNLCGFILAAGTLAAASASAAPLLYRIVGPQQVINVIVAADAVVTYGPPLLPPVTVPLLDGTSILTGRAQGTATADVGLPGAFMGGANGVVVSSGQLDTTFTESVILFTDIFGQLPPIPSPVPLVGAALVVHIAELELVLDGPLSSPLVPSGEPNEFLWAGDAPLTVNGSLNLSVAIPGQDPIGLPEPVPFSVPLSPGALAGAFSGDATSTTLDVGVEALDLEPELSAGVTIDLGALGSLDVDLTRVFLRIDGTYSLTNRTHGLPPAGGGAGGCGMGPELVLLLPALGWLRRRRARPAA